MIYEITIQRTTAYEVKVEAQGREEAESIARAYVRDGMVYHVTEDWEYIHPNGTWHYVPEGAL